MLKITRTSDRGHQYLKVLVYGQAGVGKTTLCSTVDNALIISAEGGLLSLRSHDIPVIEVSSIQEVQEAYKMIASSEECKDFEWICIDSLSEIGEVVLSTEKKLNKDPRKAYGALIDRMTDLIKAFRDLPRNVYMSAKAFDIPESQKCIPSMPGSKLGQELPYFFDEVFAYRVADTEDGVKRALQTFNCGSWEAKDRSGILDHYEDPHLGNIHTKIMSSNN